jgi:hypothetical protein
VLELRPHATVTQRPVAADSEGEKLPRVRVRDNQRALVLYQSHAVGELQPTGDLPYAAAVETDAHNGARTAVDVDMAVGVNL